MGRKATVGEPSRSRISAKCRPSPESGAEEHAQVPLPQPEPAPEGAVTLGGAAGGPVLGGGESRLDAVAGKGQDLPPVQFLDVLEALALQEGPVAQAGQEKRVELFLQTAQGGQVQVVVMGVADEHHRHGRQGVERQRGRARTARTRERHGAGALAPNRVGEDVAAAAELQQKRAVADEGGRGFTCYERRGQGGGHSSGVRMRGPGSSGTAEELPAQHIGERAPGGNPVEIVKLVPIEVVADRRQRGVIHGGRLSHVPRRFAFGYSAEHSATP